MLVAATAANFRAFLLADVGFVHLNSQAFAAHRREIAIIAHRFPDPIAHKPSAFDRNTKHASKLIAADTLLAGTHEEGSLQPNVQLDMAGLEHGADRHAALLSAGVALVEAGARCITAHPLHALHSAAMRAHRAMRPNDAFQLGVSGGFILEVGGVKDAHAITLHDVVGFDKYNIAKFLLLF